MNWSKLYSMQKELDYRIKEQHDLHNQNVLHDKMLALLVELGELANETRCFKFWSHKGPNEQNIILEEYVDGLHFILSIGIEKGFYYEPSMEHYTPNLSVTNVFLQVYEKAIQLQNNMTENNYKTLVEQYLQLGYSLGFNENMIEDAYVEKNEVNHERQNQGY